MQLVLFGKYGSNDNKEHEIEQRDKCITDKTEFNKIKNISNNVLKVIKIGSGYNKETLYNNMMNVHSLEKKELMRIL